MNVFFVEQASQSDVEQVCANLQAFNNHAIGEIAFIPIQLVVKDEAGKIIAGVIAEVALGWLEVIVLWVHESTRGNSLGSKLLNTCEDKAIKLGAHSARLDTFDWQAQSFYSKHGYTVFGELMDYPRGKKRYFMSKVLHIE